MKHLYATYFSPPTELTVKVHTIFQ